MECSASHVSDLHHVGREKASPWLARLLVSSSPTKWVRAILSVLLVINFVVASWSFLAFFTNLAHLSRIMGNTSVFQNQVPLSSPRSFASTSLFPAMLLLPSHALTPQLSSSEPFDGLGNLSFYTYMKYPINNPTCSCGKRELLVNVANGNLIAHATDIQIAGTAGLDLNLEEYYNSRANSSRDLGQNWNFSLGHDVRLDLNNPSSGVTYHGPSGFSAYFASNGNGGYNDAPGLHAGLKKNSDGTYTLTFEQTGMKYIFGTNSHLAKIQDKNNNAISISYDAQHDVTSITDSQKRQLLFQHNTALGASNDPQGQVTQITDPAGNVVKYSYDASNNLIGITDLNGNTTTFSYNGNDLIAITSALGHRTTMSYDSNDRVSTITDPNRGVTKYTYNSGNTAVTDANGHTTTYYYDSQLKVTSFKDALGNTRKTSFDSNYDITQQTDALGNANVYTYDTINDLTVNTDGSNNSLTFSYDNSNLPHYPSSAKDKEGNSIYYTYDGVGNIVKVRDGLATQNEMDYTYNSNGTLSTAKDANSNTTTYSYDSAGNLMSVAAPAPLGSQTFTYDGLSRITTVTDGKGQKTTYTYNNVNKIIGIAYADGSSISYTYDADNNVIKVADSTGTTTLAYDVLDRMTGKTLPDGTILTYSYDNIGNLLSVTDAGGTVSYSYNAVNLLSSITDPSGAKTSYTYDADVDSQTGIVYPNGVRVSYTYDGDRHISSIVAENASNAQLMNFKYTYHGDLVDTVTDLNNNKTSYDYDALDRLTEATTYNSSGSQTGQTVYSLDGPGNLTSIKVNGTVQTSFTYNAANELLTSTTGGTTTSYTYDANGNLTSDGLLTYSYNAANQTTSIGADNYTYTGSDQTERVNANGTTYTYSSLGLGRATNSSGSTYYTRDNKGKLISERTSSGTYYYLLDRLGSVIALTDSSGAIKNSYSYDAFGNSTNKTESVANPWQFASGYLDTTTGLYKFGTRYYSPKLGRWTQQDPAGGKLTDPTSLDAYTYANNDPINRVDPSGRISIDCLGSVSWNLLFGGIGVYTSIAFVVPWLTGLIAGAATLDAAVATVGAALLAGGVAILGIFGLVLLGFAAIFAIYYIIKDVVMKDCGGH